MPNPKDAESTGHETVKDKGNSCAQSRGLARTQRQPGGLRRGQVHGVRVLGPRSRVRPRQWAGSVYAARYARPQ